MLVYSKDVFDVDHIQSELKERGTTDAMDRLLKMTTALLSISFFISAVLNFILASHFVKTEPGIDAAHQAQFNAEVGAMTGWSYVVIALPSTIFLFVILYMVVHGIKKHAGLSFEEALAHATRIGFPVALKGLSRQLVHKSEAGAVELDIAHEAPLRAAWDRIHRRVDVPLEGCLVSEMVRGEVEMILGIKRDEQFGPVLVFGFGGVLVEVVDDVMTVIPPISPARALTLLRQLKLWPVLAGARGRRNRCESLTHHHTCHCAGAKKAPGAPQSIVRFRCRSSRAHRRRR